MNSVRGAEPICAICGISDICVRFWKSRDAWPLYRDDSRFLDSLRSLGMTNLRDSSTPRFALRSQ